MQPAAAGPGEAKGCQEEQRHRSLAGTAVGPLTQHVLRPGGPNDDLCSHGRHTNLHARVAVLSQFSCEELVELGIKYSICDELQAGTKDMLKGIILVCQRALTAPPGLKQLMQYCP